MSSSIHRLKSFPASLGYNGERYEAETRWQLLGAGYRAYNPELRRFHSADALSPFGAGGLNAYAYADGDPANRIDPSGRSALVSLAIVSALVAAGAGAGMALVKDDSARLALGVVVAAGTFVAITAGVKEWRLGSDQRNRIQQQRAAAKRVQAAKKAVPSGEKTQNRNTQQPLDREKVTPDAADGRSNRQRSNAPVPWANALLRGQRDRLKRRPVTVFEEGRWGQGDPDLW